jgi:hypothetical protein
VGDKTISTKNPILSKIRVYVDMITLYFKWKKHNSTQIKLIKKIKTD